jgi:hypothetical protein
MANVTFQRELNVRHEADVFVAGGGPAGVAAAVAAAQQGKEVFLAEAQDCLGGMGTAGLVPAFMCFGDGVNFLSAGVGQEILDRLAAAGGAGPNYRPENAHRGVPIRAEVLKRVYDEMLADAGVDFTLRTTLIDVETDGDSVAAAVLAAKSGIFAVRAKVYIDCTGDGDLAAWAGAPFEKGDDDGRMMAGTLCSLWASVDFEAFREAGIGHQSALLEEAFKAGVFTRNDRHLPGMWDLGEEIGGGNIGHTFDVDATDERSLTQALVWGRKLVSEYERYYKQYLKGFEKMVLVSTGSLLGVRETRRITGDYALCLEDFKNRAVFDDEIGRYSYPVDIHASDPSEESFEKFKQECTAFRYGPGESYGIPYRTLVPAKLSNVLVAGRCVSSDRYIQSSIRVMPGCYITGQAAGVAAAVAIDANTDTRGVSVAELQARLLKMGACLPNATGTLSRG